MSLDGSCIFFLPFLLTIYLAMLFWEVLLFVSTTLNEASVCTIREILFDNLVESSLSGDSSFRSVADAKLTNVAPMKRNT